MICDLFLHTFKPVLLPALNRQVCSLSALSIAIAITDLNRQASSCSFLHTLEPVLLPALNRKASQAFKPALN